MYAIDFEYDGYILSDMGFMVCHFDSQGLETVSNGSNITFNTVSMVHGEKWYLTSSQFDECLSTTIQICKKCTDDFRITTHELRALSAWLNRKQFHKFKFHGEDCPNIYFEAKMNVSRIESSGELYGLELEIQTNRPYALHEPQQFIIRTTATNQKRRIIDTSDLEGYIYPYTEITVNQAGNLTIHNDIEDRDTIIQNCSAGEKIIMDYPVITSSITSHQIQNDFNWNFFRIANTFRNNINQITISLPCTVKITYSPVVKIGL